MNPRKPRSAARRSGTLSDAELLAGAAFNTALSWDERVRMQRIRAERRASKRWVKGRRP